MCGEIHVGCGHVGMSLSDGSEASVNSGLISKWVNSSLLNYLSGK